MPLLQLPQDSICTVRTTPRCVLETVVNEEVAMVFRIGKERKMGLLHGSVPLLQDGTEIAEERVLVKGGGWTQRGQR
jgi:hypothetical protein